MRNLLKGGTAADGVKRVLLLGLVITLAGASMACATALSRTGAALVTAAKLYRNEITALKAQALITDADAARLDKQADAIEKKADAFRTQLNRFSELRKGDIPGLTAELSGLIGLVDVTLTDEAITKGKIKQDSKFIKGLRWIRASADTVSVTLSALFPPPAEGGVVAAGGIRVVEPPPVAVKTVKVDLPEMPK